MLVPDEALELIDSVAENRTAFMVEAAVAAAKVRRRLIEDAEIADICARNAASDAIINDDWEAAISDGLGT
ncbi:MAG: hypothetical protein ACYDA1_01530 [Vulcanimicrobiaceae bacterium]